MRQRINLGIVLATAGTITVFSVQPVPGPSQIGGIPLYPFYHVLAYFFLAGALLLYFHDTPKGHLEAVVVASLFGAIIEIIQYGLPTRQFSFIDILLNTAGAALILLDHRSRLVTRIIRLEDQIIEQFLR